jgi:hypothetical protein|tara:strand:+ start:180 stop:347 length:168 start_codon:yes stop_codon:yes gene_type:complete
MQKPAIRRLQDNAKLTSLPDYGIKAMKLNIDKILFAAVFVFSLITFILLVLVGVG